MKKLLLQVALVAIYILLLPAITMAQEYYDNVNTPRQWYYNNLESATAGTASTYFANGASALTGAAFTLGAGTSTNALTKSLRSAGSNALGNIRWNFQQNSATDANVSMNSAPWEWEFDYKNTTGAATDDPDAGGMVAGKNSWRYWLQTFTVSGVNCGLYVTVTGGYLQIRRKYDAPSTQYQTLSTVALPNNTDTYQIRLVRSVTGYFNVYILNRTTGVTTTSLGLNLNYYSVYNLSYIDVASTAAGRFEFDNFNFYQVKAEYIPISGVSGLTTTIYPGIVDAIPYAVNVNIRGDIQMGRYSLNMSTNGGQPIFTSAAIYKTSTLSPIAKSTSTFLANFNSVNTSNTNYADMPSSEYYYNPGNTNGTTSNVTNYAFIFQGRNPFFSNAPSSVTFSVSTVNDDTFSSFFQSVSPYTTGSASSTSAPVAVSSTAPPAAPTVSGGGTFCGTVTTTLTASGVSGATYNWYTASTGGTLLQSSTSGAYIPFVAGTTIFYVSATTAGGTSARTAVTVTITPKISSGIYATVVSWPFTSGSLADASGNGNTALPQNAPTTTTDRFGTAGNAYNFNGSNTYITSTTRFAPTQLVFSVSIWFKTTNAGGMLLGFGGNQVDPLNATHDRHIYMASTGQLVFGVYNGGFVTVKTTAGRSYADGLWHHAVATCGTTNGLQLFVDGVLRTTPQAYATPQNTGGYWRIGGDNVNGWPDANGTYFNGALDDFAVFNHELTTAEATDNEMNLYTFAPTYCANNTYTIAAPVISGATYAWVDNSNAANTSNTNPATFATATTSSYTVTVTSGTCSSVSTVTPQTPTFTWTGKANNNLDYDDNNWFNTSTGVANSKPGLTSGTESLIIPNSATIFPILYGNRSIYSLTIAQGATLTLNNNTLNVGCNLFDKNTTANGIIYGTTGTSNSLTWNGTVLNQAFYGSNTTAPAQLYRMAVNNTTANATVNIASGKIDIWNLLTMTAGKLAIPATSEVNLRHTSTTNYAQIETIASGSIQGNINYEVLFQGGAGTRNYRSMGAPVYNNTTTYSATNGSYVLSNLKNTFIITGYNGTGNGFDASSNNGSTLRTYNSATNNYTFVTNLATNVTSGTGFYMYYRGDRVSIVNPTTADPFGSKTNKTLGTGNTYATPESVIFRYTGIPNQGNVPLTALPTTTAASQYYYFVSNPYAATFDLKDLWNSASTYINSSVRTWNPAGYYATYDCNTGAVTNGGKRYVVPGQGFFIQNINASGSAQTLTATESMKKTGNSANAVRLLSTSAPVAEPEFPIVNVQLYKNNFISDEIAVVLYKDSKDSADVADAPYFGGDNMAFTTITPDNKYLSIDKRPFNETKKTIPLWVSAVTDSIYTFKNTFKSKLMSNYKVSLTDSLLNNTVEITNINYSVNITKAQPETWGRRFKLIIEQLPAPVTYYAFSGQLTPAKTGLLSWKTSEHRYGTTYRVQRSQDNKTFADIGNLQVGSTDSLRTDFNMTDNDLQKGTNYYRLVQTDVFGNKLMSNTVQLDYNLDAIPSSNGFKLYPNPVVDNFNIISDKTYTGKITLRIYDSNSNLKATKVVTQLSAYEPVQQYVSEFRLGVYIVEIKNDKNKVLTTLKFVKQ